MSDKFFFKGRQEVRKNHTGFNYKTNASQKLGTKKFPLTLVVTSEARKQEIAAQVAEAKLYANISVDETASESISELTTLLAKGSTITLEKTPNRNEPCSCGSGKKYKKCSG